MKKLTFLLLIIFNFCGCDNSSEPSLEERFSCKVDGKLFVPAEAPDNMVSGGSNLSIRYHKNGYLAFSATSANNQGIGMGCDSVVQVNVPYPINDIGFYRKESVRYDIISGLLTVTTLDTVNLQVVGTFNFIGKEKGGSIVTITDGKFNDKYTPKD